MLFKILTVQEYELLFVQQLMSFTIKEIEAPAQ